MTNPATPSEAIPYLNSYVQQNSPESLCDAMINLFTSNLEMAKTLVPAYAKFLTGNELDRLSSSFPALSPLFNGYREILGSLQAS